MNHIHSKNSKYHYEDTSNKLFSKISLVNTLKPKEIVKINDIYQKLGLYLKQVVVDKMGNELINYNKELMNKKRPKRPLMTLKEFYNKYYFITNLNNIGRIKKSKKLLKNIKKKKKEKNDINDSLEYSELNEDNKINEKYLRDLKKNLVDLYRDIQGIEYKECKIDTEEYKNIIINYIFKYRLFIGDVQYQKLLNKWKNELIKTKGANILDLDNLLSWKTPILKGLKSEIALVAISNIISRQLGEEEIANSEEKIENKSEEKKKEEESEQSSMSMSESDNEFDKNNNGIEDGDNLMEKMERNENRNKVIEDDYNGDNNSDIFE
jgi:hypothetical protein